MSNILQGEKRSFVGFLLLLFITIAVLTLNGSPSLLGILGAVWGIIGFLRVVDITHTQYDSFPKFLSLPSQLLFGLEKQKEQDKKLILKRFERLDCVLWFAGSIFFVVWAVYCSLFPAEISIIKTLQLKQELLVDLPIKGSSDVYVIIMSLASYGVVGIAIFMALSYAQTGAAVRWTSFSLFPLFLVGTALALHFLPVSNPALFPDMAVFKGGGFGKAFVVGLLEPNVINNSRTGLMIRFIETGWVGAYGAYILFLPAVFMLVKALFNAEVLKSVIGLLSLFLVAFLDIFWISIPIISSLGLAGLTIAALCWGAVGARK